MKIHCEHCGKELGEMPAHDIPWPGFLCDKCFESENGETNPNIIKKGERS